MDRSFGRDENKEVFWRGTEEVLFQREVAGGGHYDSQGLGVKATRLTLMGEILWNVKPKFLGT